MYVIISGRSVSCVLPTSSTAASICYDNSSNTCIYNILRHWAHHCIAIAIPNVCTLASALTETTETVLLAWIVESAIRDGHSLPRSHPRFLSRGWPNSCMLGGPATILCILCDACSDRIAKLFYACFYGVWYKYRARGIAPYGRGSNLPEKVSCDMGYRSDSIAISHDAGTKSESSLHVCTRSFSSSKQTCLANTDCQAITQVR